MFTFLFKFLPLLQTYLAPNDGDVPGLHNVQVPNEHGVLVSNRDSEPKHDRAEHVHSAGCVDAFVRYARASGGGVPDEHRL
tara:strand:- start:3 stop:245 length:243 start_codon:yes stop_codon:yes gene_type:complete